MPELLGYTSQLMAWRGHQQNYVDYIERLTEMKTDELKEVSQDCKAWHKPVVMCTDPQPPD